MGVAKIQTCYGFTCPSCGTRNYCEGVTPEITEEDRLAIMADQGVDPNEQGELVCVPDKVVCQYCKDIHETIDPREAEGEQWYDDPKE